MSRLRLHVEGEVGAISLHSFLLILGRSLNMLADLDRSITREARGTLDWLVTDLGTNSLDAYVRSVPRKEAALDERIGRRVSASFVAGIDSLERGEALPPNFSEVGLNHLRLLSRSLGANGATAFRATFIDEDQSASVSTQSSVNVERLLAPQTKAIGSVIGVLDLISLRRQPRYNVYDRVSRRPVRCAFESEQLEVVKSALGRRVLVSGIVNRNSRGQPVRIDSPTLTLLPSEDDLPSTDEIIGIDPGFTGDVSTEAYVRQLRNA